LITEFYEISAIVMAETYLKNQHGREEVYRKLSDKENKKEIVENILCELFKDKNGKEVNCLTFDEFNSVFVKNRNVGALFYYYVILNFFYFLCFSFVLLDFSGLMGIIISSLSSMLINRRLNLNLIF
jgi:hypothetical protein